MNMMATRRRKRPFPLKPLLLPQRHLLAGLAVAFAVTILFIVLVLLSTPPSSAPSRFVDTRSPSSHSSHCGATSLGEFGDMMVSMLPKNLAFTVFVPSPESFRRVLKLRPNDSVAEGKASHTYAVVSRVLGFSAVPRRLRAGDVPLHERVRLLDSVSGLKIYAWRDVDGALDVNGVRSECVDIISDESIVHVMAGVLMDADFERSFSSDY